MCYRQHWLNSFRGNLAFCLLFLTSILSIYQVQAFLLSYSSKSFSFLTFSSVATSSFKSEYHIITHQRKLFKNQLTKQYSQSNNKDNKFKVIEFSDLMSMFGGGQNNANIGSSSTSSTDYKEESVATKSLDLLLNNENILSWEMLEEKMRADPKGSNFLSNYMEMKALRGKGSGTPHISQCDYRTFGKVTNIDDIRVVFYKDAAGWCPYCQKVWMHLEEKKIPYKIERINMRSYGDKPASFLAKVPSGLLPAVEIDGKLITDSVVIMKILEDIFPDHKMMPSNKNGGQDSKELIEYAEELLQFERILFSGWCQFIFRPHNQAVQVQFENLLDQVDTLLGRNDIPGKNKNNNLKGENEVETTSPRYASPWFLKGNSCSVVDLVYVSHIERMCASTAYWRGLQIRGNSRWKNINRWFDAFDELPSYQASKSDFYTHIKDIPPQYGPGIINSQASSLVEFQGILEGIDETSWNSLVLNCNKQDMTTFLEPSPQDTLPPSIDYIRDEAAWKLIENHDNIVKFCCRAVGEKGTKQFSAPLADPYATPNSNYYEEVSAALRIVVTILLKPFDEINVESRLEENIEIQTILNNSIRCYKNESDHQKEITQEDRKIFKKKLEGIALALEYLQKRVGVPRDMSYPAARVLRGSLGYLITVLRE